MFEGMTLKEVIKKLENDNNGRYKELQETPRKPKITIQETSIGTELEMKQATERMKLIELEFESLMKQYTKKYDEVKKHNESVWEKYPTKFDDVLHFIYEIHGVTKLSKELQDSIGEFIYEVTDNENLQHISWVVEQLMKVINKCK